MTKQIILSYLAGVFSGGVLSYLYAGVVVRKTVAEFQKLLGSLKSGVNKL